MKQGHVPNRLTDGHKTSYRLGLTYANKKRAYKRCTFLLKENSGIAFSFSLQCNNTLELPRVILQTKLDFHPNCIFQWILIIGTPSRWKMWWRNTSNTAGKWILLDKVSKKKLEKLDKNFVLPLWLINIVRLYFCILLKSSFTSILQR